MSVSRGELEGMDRDELVETVDDLSTTVQMLEAHLEAMSRWKESMNDDRDALLDRLDALEAENRRLSERLVNVEATAQGAYREANAGNHGKKSKTQLARDLTRNVLIKRCAQGATGTHVPITTKTVQQLADDAHGRDLKWQTIRDAWDSLQEDWPQFYDTKKNGLQALSVKKSEVTPALVQAVQADLGRDDLAKPLLGEKPTTGGSA